jgi:hypothetical protein
MSLYYFKCLMKEGRNVIRIAEDGFWLNNDGQIVRNGAYEWIAGIKGYYLLLDGKAPDKYLEKRSRQIYACFRRYFKL